MQRSGHYIGMAATDFRAECGCTHDATSGTELSRTNSFKASGLVMENNIEQCTVNLHAAPVIFKKA